MIGRILIVGIVAFSLAAGAAMYWLQVYAFYDEEVTGGPVRLTTYDGATEEIVASEVREIDAASSPLRYRGCFATPMSQALLTETYVVVEDANPTVAPGWFDCFDAAAIGAALETGDAVAFLGERNVSYGFDRLVAIDRDGRGYAWHQINLCGERVFDGEPPPAECPDAPAGQD